MATKDRSGFASALPALLALALAMMLGFTMMASFGAVQEGAKAEMALSDYTLGIVQGISAALALVVFSIPIGILVDRTNRTRLILVLVMMFIGGTLMTAFAHDVTLLFLARMITAIGTTGALTASLSLCADLCGPAQRGRANLVVNLGKAIGLGLAFGLTGWLFGLFAHGRMPVLLSGIPPWRGAHLALGAMGVILLPLLLIFLREPERHEVAADIHAPFKVVAGELWSRRIFLIPLFLGQVSVVMADNAAAVWAAPVLSRSFGVQPDQFAAWMGILVVVSGIGGAIIGGLAADGGQKSGRRGGLLLGAIVAAAIGVPAALFPVSPSLPVFAVALGTLILCGSITGVITSVALTVYIPNELRGLCIGAFIAFAGVIGYGIAPTLVAAASSILGGEQHLDQGLAIVGVLTSAMSVIAFTFAMRRAPSSATAAL